MIRSIQIGREYWYMGLTVKVLELKPKTFGRPQLAVIQETSLASDRQTSTVFARAFRSGATPTRF